MNTQHVPELDPNAPIGMMDSGVGGLTVARAVMDLLPHESLLYIGDTARSPYGTKPIAQVRAATLEIMDELVSRGVKMIVIACNSASSATLRDARERYSIPVVEVIGPATRRAAAASRSGQIGVIATEMSVASRAYDDAFSAAPNVEITSSACPKFVEFVEKGQTTGPEVLQAAAEYLAPLQQAQVDTVVLGCTHYPFLAGAISYVMGEDVTLVSSAEETALDVYRTLAQSQLLQSEQVEPTYQFVVTGDPASFAKLGHHLLGPEIGHVARMETDPLGSEHDSI